MNEDMPRITIVWDTTDCNPLAPEDAIRRLQDQYPHVDLRHFREHLDSHRMKAYLRHQEIVFTVTIGT